MTRKANGDLIRSLVEKLRELPDGYAVSTWGLLELTGNLSDENNTDAALTAIDRALFKAAEKENIILDMSAHEGMCEGLPYALDFVVRKPETCSPAVPLN